MSFTNEMRNQVKPEIIKNKTMWFICHSQFVNLIFGNPRICDESDVPAIWKQYHPKQ